MKRSILQLCAIIQLAIIFLAVPVRAQVRSGAAFLKIIPGARIQSMAGTSTSLFDDPHAIFANPAAAASFREWEWSAGYTKWVADISHASFVYGRRAAMPWSRDFRIGVGLAYQGISTFNNNSAVMPEASASDLLAGFTVGQPLTFLSRNLSVGMSAKYLNSILAQYSAKSFIMDYGLMARTNVMSIAQKYKGVASFGLAFLQNGGDLKYIQLGTPLPQTTRIGGSFYLGKPGGFSSILSADYVKTKDEDPYLAIGAEVRINKYIALYGGYNFGSDLFKKFTFGAGFRLDDVSMPGGEAFPGKNNAFRVDIASLDASEYFSRTYQGTITHFSSRPEPFQLTGPTRTDTISRSEVVLKWQEAADGDLFDNVRYRVLVHRDSMALSSLFDAYENNPELFSELTRQPMVVNRQTEDTFLPIGLSEGGKYYWTVIAEDETGHVRFAESSQQALSSFTVLRSDIEIKDIKIEYTPYITMDDYHGDIKVRVRNNGDRPARNLSIRLVDSAERIDYNLESFVSAGSVPAASGKKEVFLTIDELLPGQEKTVKSEWHTSLLGRHRLFAQVKNGETIDDLNPANNTFEKYAFTVPKGNVASREEHPVINAKVQRKSKPVIPIIAFDRQSDQLRKEYVANNIDKALLPLIAERLRQNPQAKIRLQGFADPNSGEELSIADRRAAKIRKTLINLKVKAEQVELLPGILLPRRAFPADSIDAEMLRQERRRVEIYADAKTRHVVMAPVVEENVTVASSTIDFYSDITSTMPLTAGEIVLLSELGQQKQKLSRSTILSKELSWHLSKEMSAAWFSGELEYYLSLSDSLGRTFQTPVQTFEAKLNRNLDRQDIVLPVAFGAIQPVSDVSWQAAIASVKAALEDSTIRVKVEGHACRIGSELVNQKLSLLRARFFSEHLQSILSKEFDAEEIASRFDVPAGFGESRPLIRNGTTVNQTALARQLNRRVEIILYKSAS